jgi:hypothetical protein
VPVVAVRVPAATRVASALVVVVVAVAALAVVVAVSLVDAYVLTHT